MQEYRKAWENLARESEGVERACLVAIREMEKTLANGRGDKEVIKALKECDDKIADILQKS